MVISRGVNLKVLRRITPLGIWAQRSTHRPMPGGIFRAVSTGKRLEGPGSITVICLVTLGGKSGLGGMVDAQDTTKRYHLEVLEKTGQI